MTQIDARTLTKYGAEVMDVINFVESGTGDGRIPAAYRPLIKNLAEAAIKAGSTCTVSPVKIYLEDDLVTDKYVFMALSQGCKLKSDRGDFVWINHKGTLCSTNGHRDIFDEGKQWKVVGEYDWYQIGMLLADGYNLDLVCMCKRDNGWFKDEIVAYAPSLDKPFVGKTKSFYKEVIIISSSEGHALPLMEV